MILVLFLPWTTFGRTWYISPQGPLTTIKQALEMAASGDTVLVRQGTYREKGLIIVKPVCLKGLNAPILDGENKYEIISVHASRVTIEGFRLINSGWSGWNDIAAIKICAQRDVTIKNNRLEHTFFGILYQNAVRGLITGNTLLSDAGNEIQSGNGIHCWHCDSMRIEHNEISGHRDGIYFEFVTHSIILGNHSFDNVRYGLHFMFSHEDSYIDNIFRHNAAGVSVMFSHGVTMLGNTFTENGGGGAYGILMKEITDSYVHGNSFLNNTIGIYMEGTTRVKVIGNRFNANGYALKIQASCSSDTITRNNFSGNTFDVATNGSLVLNNFDGNYWDKYEGYDLNRDGIGDVPYHPVSLYSMIAEKNPAVMMLFHSFIVTLLDRTEKIMPGITPENLKDDRPFIKQIKLRP